MGRLRALDGIGQYRKLLAALSGVSPYRLKKCVKSNKSFNDLKLNEIIKLDDVTINILNNHLKEN